MRGGTKLLVLFVTKRRSYSI